MILFEITLWLVSLAAIITIICELLKIIDIIRKDKK